MGEAGNSGSNAERKRLEIALRGTDPDRVLERARAVPDLGLRDALTIAAFLAQHDDARADRAGARLLARILEARPLGIEEADVVYELVRRLPDPAAVAELRRFVA